MQDKHDGEENSHQYPQSRLSTIHLLPGAFGPWYVNLIHVARNFVLVDSTIIMRWYLNFRLYPQLSISLLSSQHSSARSNVASTIVQM